MTRAKIEAEKQCRKFHAGKVPRTLAVMQAIYHILYWKGVKKEKTGRTICNTILQHWAKTGLEIYLVAHQQLETSEIQLKVKGAMQEYLQIKKQADCQDTWMAQIIQAQLDYKNTDKAKLWHQLKQKTVQA